jgi:hypothetical protein
MALLKNHSVSDLSSHEAIIDSILEQVLSLVKLTCTVFTFFFFVYGPPPRGKEKLGHVRWAPHHRSYLILVIIGLRKTYVYEASMLVAVYVSMRTLFWV